MRRAGEKNSLSEPIMSTFSIWIHRYAYSSINSSSWALIDFMTWGGKPAFDTNTEKFYSNHLTSCADNRKLISYWLKEMKDIAPLHTDDDVLWAKVNMSQMQSWCYCLLLVIPHMAPSAPHLLLGELFVVPAVQFSPDTLELAPPQPGIFSQVYRPSSPAQWTAS